MDRPTEKVVVGLEIKDNRKTGKPEVIGLIAVFGDNPVRFKSLEALAEVLAPHDYDIVEIPHEEGWDGVCELPALARRKLDRIIRDMRLSNELMQENFNRDWSRMNNPIFSVISRVLERFVPEVPKDRPFGNFKS